MLSGISQPVDLMFLLDVSREVNHLSLQRMKEFVLSQAQLYNLSSEAARFGIMTYAYLPRKVLPISLGLSPDSVSKSLGEIVSSDSPRRIEPALRSVRENIFTGKDGVRKDAGKVIVLLVAGQDRFSSSIGLIRETSALKQADVDVLVVSLSPKADQSKIRSIATSSNDFIPLASPNHLYETVDEIYDAAVNANRLRHKLDLGFILGSRGPNAEEDFNTGKVIITEMMERMAINGNQIQTAFTVYGSHAKLVLLLKGRSYRRDAIKVVKRAQFPGDGEALKEALDVMRSIMFNEYQGARNDVPRTVVILLNDELDEPAKQATETLMKSGTKIIFVTLGKVPNLDGLRGFPTVIMNTGKDSARETADEVLPRLLAGLFAQPIFANVED